MKEFQQPPVRLRIWDTVERRWIKDDHNRKTGAVREFFISQNGELWIHESDANGKFTLSLAENGSPGRYLTRLACGVHAQSRKLYFGDILMFTDKTFGESYGVLLSVRGQMCIGSGPIGNYTAIDTVPPAQIEAAEVVGNIFENPDFYDKLTNT
jgi:hypothetical protein